MPVFIVGSGAKNTGYAGQLRNAKGGNGRKKSFSIPLHIQVRLVPQENDQPVLLIAAVLGDSELRDLLALSRKLGMAALIEVHDEEELARVVPLQPRLIGINNRDLQTFEIDFGNTARLRALVPPEIAVVGESGLKTPDDVRAMKAAGVDAVLVGEALVRSKDIGGATRAFVAAGQ